MPNKTISIPINFGGLDTIGQVGSLGDGAGTATDVRLGLHNELVTYPGSIDYTAYLSSALIYGMRDFNDSVVWFGKYDGTNTYIKYIDTGASPKTSTFIRYNHPTFTGAYPDFASINSKLFIADSYNLMMSWTGALSGNVSLSANCLDIHQDRLFASGAELAGTGTYKSYLYWSDIADGTSFPAANYEIVGNVNETIKAVRSYQDSLFVLKSNTAFKISGNDFDPTSGNYTIDEMPHVKVGPSDKRGVCLANNKLYWVSRWGLVEFNGQTQNVLGTGRITPASSGGVSAILPREEEGEIIFTFNAVTYIYNFINNKFYKTNWGTLYSATRTGNGLGNALLTSNSSYIESLTAATNYGNSAITSDYRTDFLTPSPVKWQPRKLHLILKNETTLNLVLTVYADYNTTDVYYTRTITQADLTGIGTSHLIVELPSKYIDCIQFKFANSTLDKTFKVLKAWYEAIIEDTADRYSGNRRIE